MVILKKNVSHLNRAQTIEKVQTVQDAMPTKVTLLPRNNNSQRASKNTKPMSKEAQLIAINAIIRHVLMNEMTQGQALRELRMNVLGIGQDAYTQIAGVSRKTLSEIENDKGNYTAEIINKVFAPFKLTVGLVPTSSQLLVAIMTD
ncbi:helix-turn-helix transcriptional regulator [Marinomonas sp. IMCC 4694]|uniref:helix-turn-helix transcriptional regulator n=1 Tax=Marinomonas sp. IMCC 4694 TaxID=2605432 RepID=UPI0011E80A22|nr:helix-turn-helix transcriptional regulator [Marinomonas sp. IMCC 4694]TYL48995.1 helix-turn-helix transcriptional regulator [Marinomonas sp. IMCC 4694]